MLPVPRPTATDASAWSASSSSMTPRWRRSAVAAAISSSRNGTYAARSASIAASAQVVEADEYGPSALDPPDDEPVALVGLVVVGTEAHVRARAAVDGRQHADLLEALLHALRCEQVRAREPFGDQPCGVVA